MTLTISQNPIEESKLKKRIRFLISFFICALVFSGVTAIPLVLEISILNNLFGKESFLASSWPSMSYWISFVYDGLTQTNVSYPFLAYGTDWLAFAHIIIAVAFIGPLRDPVKNIWIIEWGLIACVMIIPTVIIFGPIRGIPIIWRLIDCCFGIFGFVPLWLVRRDILTLSHPKQSKPFN